MLSGHSYHAADVHQWTSDISSLCLKNLKNVANGSAGFKYIGNNTPSHATASFIHSFTIHNLHLNITCIGFIIIHPTNYLFLLLYSFAQ